MVLWLPELQNGMQTSSYCRDGESWNQPASVPQGPIRVKGLFGQAKSYGRSTHVSLAATRSISKLLRHQDGKHWTKRTDYAFFQTPTS
jgi:hypothetical protein